MFSFSRLVPSSPFPVQILTLTSRRARERREIHREVGSTEREFRWCSPRRRSEPAEGGIKETKCSPSLVSFPLPHSLCKFLLLLLAEHAREERFTGKWEARNVNFVGAPRGGDPSPRREGSKKQNVLLLSSRSLFPIPCANSYSYFSPSTREKRDSQGSGKHGT